MRKMVDILGNKVEKIVEMVEKTNLHIRRLVLQRMIVLKNSQTSELGSG